MREIVLHKQKSIGCRIVALITATLIVLGCTSFVNAEQLSSTIATELLVNDNGYSRYCKENPIVLTQKEISLDLSAAKLNGGQLKREEDRTVLHTEEEGSVKWTFDVKEAGSYAISFDYKPLPGTNGAIKRQILIDGKIPYDEANSVSFSRIFRDVAEIERDVNSGNDIRPQQEEVAYWTSAFVRDVSGYYGDRLYFYLTAGTHTLEIRSLQEPMAMASVKLTSTEAKYPTYEEKLAQWRAEGAVEVAGKLENGITYIEAERMHEKSTPSLYAVNDTSSSATSPSHPAEQRLNCVGGTRWQEDGEWISWIVDVPESGLYTIGCRFLQNTARDVPAGRTLYVNGEIPFQEASAVGFTFDNKFQTAYVGGDTPYLFYLKQGKNEIRLEATTAIVSELLIEVSDALNQLNQANWSLLTLIGVEPDMYKNYYIDEQLPEVMDVLTAQASNFRTLAKRWFEMTGETDANVSQLEQVAFRLEKMAADADQIPSMYSSFKDDLGALGDMIANARKQPLMLDYLFVCESGVDLPKADNGFFANVWYEIRRLISSYFNDYNGIAVSDDAAAEKITVWIGSGVTGGRDQALALNQMIVQDFSTHHGIAVNLQLVPGGTILPATLAGVGPDVALSISSGTPVEYAMRGAVLDLSKFDDFDEVMKRFVPASYTSYQYLGGTYAIPETVGFSMLFARTDIMSSLGIDVESLKTWQDIMDILPQLQRQNMNFAIPAGYDSYVMFLYQNGGELYNDDGKTSALDTRVALDAFNNYVRFYSDYSTPYAYSFDARFRTGEIPLGISGYTTYNSLMISAPEIQGKWRMLPLPGTLQADGTIDNTGIGSGSGSIIMAASKHQDSAWEFIKWWTDADAQYQFGRELESVMGPAARYNTANIEALQLLPWQSADRASLMEQMEHLRGLPEVPGGYMTSRNIGFAIRKVYNENVETRNTLLSYVDSINKELKIKREEFGLE